MTTLLHTKASPAFIVLTDKVFSVAPTAGLPDVMKAAQIQAQTKLQALAIAYAGALA
ncbi:hypothetical protein [Bowmanella denitrificans]|uniref:hypothetical protein n=1 Tax=Bowmanella denitrificans TaxID=366582 RepID=UPI0015587803|nr:hypothetical protein [Bowmanella denitrificans]